MKIKNIVIKQNDINYYFWKGACDYCNDIENIEGFENIWNEHLKGICFKGKYCCHHKKELEENKSFTQLISENLYYNRPAHELIFLTTKEHAFLHSKGRPSYTKGKKLALEHRQKLSESHKGLKYSLEHRQKISESHKGEKNPNFGKKISTQIREKISSTLKGRKQSQETCKKRSESIKRYWERVHNNLV